MLRRRKVRVAEPGAEGPYMRAILALGSGMNRTSEVTLALVPVCSTVVILLHGRNLCWLDRLTKIHEIAHCNAREMYKKVE